MDAVCRRLNTPHFFAHILSLGRESPKAENLPITKGKLLHFSLPKAENILKTSQLREMQKNGFGMAKCPPLVAHFLVQIPPYVE
jgi:hypothetical protein